MMNPEAGLPYDSRALTYSPAFAAVPLALTGLTALFEMGRGDPRR